MAVEFPSYYEAIRRMSVVEGSTTGPPSYGSGNGRNGQTSSPTQVETVSGSVKMVSVDLHQGSERSKENGGGLTILSYDVTRPVSEEPAAEAVAKAAIYAEISPRKSAEVHGVTNEAFVHEDTKSEMSSKASSIEGPPISSPFDEAGTAM